MSEVILTVLALLVAVVVVRTTVLERAARDACGVVVRPVLVRRLDRLGLVLAAVAFSLLAAAVLAVALR